MIAQFDLRGLAKGEHVLFGGCRARFALLRQLIERVRERGAACEGDVRRMRCGQPRMHADVQEYEMGTEGLRHRERRFENDLVSGAAAVGTRIDFIW